MNLFHLEFLFNFNESSFWVSWQSEPWKGVICVNQWNGIITTYFPVYYLFVIFDLPWTVSVVYLPLSTLSPSWAPGLLMEGRAVISALLPASLGFN